MLMHGRPCLQSDSKVDGLYQIVNMNFDIAFLELFWEQLFKLGYPNTLIYTHPNPQWS